MLSSSEIALPVERHIPADLIDPPGYRLGVSEGGQLFPYAKIRFLQYILSFGFVAKNTIRNTIRCLGRALGERAECTLVSPAGLVGKQAQMLLVICQNDLETLPSLGGRVESG